jgi:outer membrane protein
MSPIRAALFAALTLSTSPALAQVAARPLIDQCTASTCKARLTAPQLLVEAQALIAAKRYAEVKPMLAALGDNPAFRLETRYLTGFVAAETGDLDTAIGEYRAILNDDPSQTRVRLELARAYLMQGKTAQADHHFKLAQADQTLPPDIARVVRSARNIIRSKRAWTFNVDIGIAPDTNINNATDANGVTLFFGETPLDFTLDEAAKARSGTGLTGLVQAGLRLPVAKKTALLVDLDLNGTNYGGSDFDDYTAQLAVGPELRLSEKVSVSAQALGAQRWYGGDVASRQGGSRIAVQATLSDVDRVGVQIDARRTDALFDENYDGWQVGAYASYERVVAKNAIASASLFVRRDWLTADAYSNTELGGALGIGAELPWGFNAGANFGASRAVYDDAIPLFSADARADWRLNGRLTLGNRKVQLFGFSPSVTLSGSKTISNIDYYSNERARIRFGVARYF